ncbi:hypothetical protein KFK09_019936 [Dendrobium nobile]|uniref:Uncharacterized protein n=1 Tax=Dendrobium nobile TaxID=94219 RepID=A0A8T3AQX1_DENNO|nr:hypothetical protein KFK09_019936 [Dendrobium nobile]
MLPCHNPHRPPPTHCWSLPVAIVGLSMIPNAGHHPVASHQSLTTPVAHYRQPPLSLTQHVIIDASHASSPTRHTTLLNSTVHTHYFRTNL